MNPALWGLASALAFGVNDLVIRVSGREVGTGTAAFGAFIAGAAALGLWLWVTGTPLVWSLDGIVPLVATGVGLAAATLVLVGSLSRGPVSVVAPILHAYPAFIVIWALFLGIVPTAVQWAAMAAVMIGVWIVARTSHEAIEAEPVGRVGVRPYVLSRGRRRRIVRCGRHAGAPKRPWSTARFRPCGSAGSSASSPWFSTCWRGGNRFACRCPGGRRWPPSASSTAPASSCS